MKDHRSIIVFVMLLFITAVALGGEQITLQKVQGDVRVRAGVTETWAKANAGDLLAPDATLKTGKQSSALVVVSSNKKKISLPSEVMVDISDIRQLTQEELMLKLTMARVRASSYEWKNKDLNMPNTTTVHGPPKDTKDPLTEMNPEVGVLQMNGTVALYESGFYSTSALKAMEVMLRYPSLGSKFDNRLLVAQALEKANLRSEALNEYVNLSYLPGIAKEQRELVQSRIARLKGQ